MRTGVAILTAVLAMSVAGCGGDDSKADKHPSAPLTEITVSCDKFADTAQRITDAQTALYSESGGVSGSAAIDKLVTELDELKDGAPADIKTALDNLAAGFRDAERILASPTTENKADLAEVSTKLAKDGRRVTAYIVSKCD